MHILRITTAATLVVVLSGCGSSHPPHVDACMGEAVKVINRATYLQFEMMERIHTTGLDGEEVQRYEREILGLQSRVTEVLDELSALAAKHDLNVLALADEVLISAAYYTRRIRRQFPTASDLTPLSDVEKRIQ